MISESAVSDFKRLVEDGMIKDDMIPKVEACVRTVESGVEKAHNHRRQEAARNTAGAADGRRELDDDKQEIA